MLTGCFWGVAGQFVEWGEGVAFLSEVEGLKPLRCTQMSMEKKLRRKSEHGSHSSVYKVLQYVVSNSSVQYLEDYRY